MRATRHDSADTDAGGDRNSESTTRFPTLILGLVAIHVAIVLSILLQDRSIIWPLHNDTIHRIGPAADFNAIYHAAINYDRGLSPYALNDDGVTPPFYAFRYLPIVAIAGQAFTYLSPAAAYVLWILVLEVLLGVFVFVVWRHCEDETFATVVAAALLLNSPYFLELHMGQFTFASVTLCCLVFFVSRPIPVLCASVLLKPLTLVALPVCFLTRRLRTASLYTAAVFALLTVPYFIRHSDQWEVFYTSNFLLTGGLDAGNYGFLRLLHLAAADLGWTGVIEGWSIVTGVLRAVLLIGVLVIVLFARDRSPVPSVAALLLAHFLTYQHVWEHHLTGVAVLAAAFIATGPRRSAAILSLAALVLIALPTPFALLDAAKDPAVWDPSVQWPRYASYVLVLSKVAPTVLLFGVVMRELCSGGFRLGRYR